MAPLIQLNRCPECHRGVVFRGPYRMNQVCSACGLKFEREQGYFVGAWVLSYFMGALSMIPTVIYLVRVAEASLPLIIGVVGLQIVLLNPIFSMLSRLLWMKIETASRRR